jgi:hypothetical protein
MGHALDREPFIPPSEPNGEHPIIALLAVLAIILTILLITWARLEVHGAADLQAALAEHAEAHPPPAPKPHQERVVEDAVTSSRWATGLSP